MSDDKKVNVETGGTGALALALLLIMFWGEPDIATALIQFLQSSGCPQ